MKAVLSAHYRFKKQHHLNATEAGRFNCDFLTVKEGIVYDIEIKVSKADLNNDFKKPKHRFYESGRSPHVPTYFYFCVPEKLAEYAVAKCIDKPYGVMMVQSREDSVNKPWMDRVKIVKRAKKLHTREADTKLKKGVLARLSSEMANLRIENENLKLELNELRTGNEHTS